MRVIRDHKKRKTTNKKPKGVAIFTVFLEGDQVWNGQNFITVLVSFSICSGEEWQVTVYWGYGWKWKNNEYS